MSRTAIDLTILMVVAQHRNNGSQPMTVTHGATDDRYAVRFRCSIVYTQLLFIRSLARACTVARE